MTDGAVEPKRDAHEVYFRYPRLAQRIPEIIRQAADRSNGDKDAFISWLFEAVMRLKTLGPDVELFGEDMDIDSDDF